MNDKTTIWRHSHEAPKEVREAMSVCVTEPGRYRARFLVMHDGTFYLMWTGGSAGEPATHWTGPFTEPVS